jgi:Rieske Fe-S protein
MPEAPPPPSIDHGRRALSAWLWRLPVIGAALTGIFGVWQAYRVHFAKDPPNPNPTFRSLEPVPIAPLGTFTEVWSSAEFVLGGWPCLAVRLPEPIPGGLSTAEGVHFAAFTRICTHQHCVVELNRDLEAVAFAFNHRSDTPSLTCACHYSVFDPQRAGRAVSGPAVRPLPRARLILEARSDPPILLSDGLELT